MTPRLTFAPRLSPGTIEALAKLITGDPVRSRDAPVAPYRTKKEIETFFFALLGAAASSHLDSRGAMVSSELHRRNGTLAIVTLVEGALSVSAFVGRDAEHVAAAGYLSEHLIADGLRLSRAATGYELCEGGPPDVVAAGADPSAILTDAYVRQQIAKCDDKLAARDLDGAITNARTLIEAVLFAIEMKTTGKRTDHRGELAAQFKQVTKLLRIDAERTDMDQRFKDVVRGLGQVIGGLAPLRNKMSDAHAREVAPARHHAVLVVNASKTLALFLVDSFNFQVERGTVAAVVAPAPRAVDDAAENGRPGPPASSIRAR